MWALSSRRGCSLCSIFILFFSNLTQAALEPRTNGCRREDCQRRCIRCENHPEPFQISCKEDPTVRMLVQSAFWGRKLPYSTVCPAPSGLNNLNCVDPTSEARLKTACHNKTECPLKDVISAADPCPGTGKYVEIYFTCTKGKIPGEVSDTCWMENRDHRCIICQQSEMTINCSKQEEIIVQSAFYGRKEPFSKFCYHTLCDHSINNTNCEAKNSSDAIKNQCDNKSSCTLEANNDVFGNPCNLTGKYIDVKYKCKNCTIPGSKNDVCWQEGGAHRCIICQQSPEMTINCSQDQVIEIQSAFYGRKEPFSKYCSHRDCRWQNNTTECEAAFSNDVINATCQYKSSCKLNASNEVFGNPCSATEKYIDVNYKCKKCTDQECVGRRRLIDLEVEIQNVLRGVRQPDMQLTGNYGLVESFNYSTVISSGTLPTLSLNGVELALVRLFNDTDFAMALSVLSVGLDEKQSYVHNASQLAPAGYPDVFAINDLPLFAAAVSNLASGLTTQAVVSYTLAYPRNFSYKVEVEPKLVAQAGGREVHARGFWWVCAFVDFGTVSYSNQGCQPTATVDGWRLTCRCNHTTIFSVLLAVDAVVLPPHVKILSYVTGGVSVLFLTITVIALCKVRRRLPNNDRIFIQINLALALLVFHALNLVHDAALLNPMACEGLAVCLHYSLLSTVFWMLVEGIALAIKTSSMVLRFENIERIKVNAAMALFGWALPAVVAAVTALLGFFAAPPYLAASAAYRAGFVDAKYDRRCFLTYQTPLFYVAVIGPVCFGAAVNLAVLAHVAAVAYRMRTKKPARPMTQVQDSRWEKGLEAARVAKLILMLVPVTGIPFLLGVFVGLGSTLDSAAFMYLHLTVNGLQGLFVFIIYCVLSREVREAVVTVFKQIRQ